MPIEPAAIINPQVVADENRVVVRKRKIEAVPASNCAQADECLTPIQPREMNSIPARRKFDV